MYTEIFVVSLDSNSEKKKKSFEFIRETIFFLHKARDTYIFDWIDGKKILE